MKFLYVALLSFLSIFYSINKYIDILSIVISSLLIIVVILSIIYNNKIIVNKKNIIYSIICSIILSLRSAKLIELSFVSSVGCVISVCVGVGV